MAGRELTKELLGNQELVHAKESRGTAARWTDDARGWKKGSPTGLASPKPLGDIAKEIVANVGKNPTPYPSPAMADLPNNLQGKRESLGAQETRRSKEHRTDDARGAKNGKKRGLASRKLRGDKTANNVTTSKKMDYCVKKGEQLKDEERGAVRARILEQKRASGPPPPKRGAVTKAIAVDLKEVVVAGVKKVIDTGKAFCCAPEPSVVDAILVDLPFPTWSEPTATLWAKVEV